MEFNEKCFVERKLCDFFVSRRLFSVIGFGAQSPLKPRLFLFSERKENDNFFFQKSEIEKREAETETKVLRIYQILFGE